jgi:hypothetical protein
MGLQAVRRGAGPAGLPAIARLLVLVALTALVATGCGGPDPKTARLIDKLEATKLTLYEVSLRDARPVSAKVNGDGEIEVRYDRTNGYYGFTLVIRKATYDPQVCTKRREQGATCSWRDGIMRSTFEEMSDVALDRSGEHLGLGGLVTESDPTLLEDAVKALQKAKVVDAKTVAAY